MSTAEPEAAITTGDVTFPFNGESRPAYVARPQGDGPFPGVVVIHEIVGLNENIRDVTRRLARAGYAALAVDLFAGRGNRTLCMWRLLASQIRNSPGSRGVSELRAALSYLAAQPEVDATRLGAVGFCLGGGYAIAWACGDGRLKAIAPFYGMRTTPLSALARSCPVVGSYPDHDISTCSSRMLERRLTRYGIAHDIKVYAGAQHSFFNDRYPAHYNAAASEDSWRRVLAFFDEHVR
ncbi:MAG TPA: dienelactone hydrolase family protein [Ktedonobacterales bacterium]